MVALGAVVGWTYPLIMFAAITAGVALSRRTQQRLPLSTGQRWGLAAGAFSGAMIGAKAPYLLADWDGLCNGSAWFADGKTILFGFAGGYLGVELAKWALDIRVKTGDTFAVPAAVAVAIGRLACYAGGCCYGLPTTMPWGVIFRGDGPRHPAQLYEAMFHATAAAALVWIGRKGWFRGQRFKLYVIAYAVFRLVTEPLRPEPALAHGLTFYQWAALGLIVVFAALWARDARRMAAGTITAPI